MQILSLNTPFFLSPFHFPYNWCSLVLPYFVCEQNKYITFQSWIDDIPSISISRQLKKSTEKKMTIAMEYNVTSTENVNVSISRSIRILIAWMWLPLINGCALQCSLSLPLSHICNCTPAHAFAHLHRFIKSNMQKCCLHLWNNSNSSRNQFKSFADVFISITGVCL